MRSKLALVLFFIVFLPMQSIAHTEEQPEAVDIHDHEVGEQSFAQQVASARQEVANSRNGPNDLSAINPWTYVQDRQWFAAAFMVFLWYIVLRGLWTLVIITAGSLLRHDGDNK